MKEYQYSIIRRESRSPKRHRNTSTVSQSDLEALRQELTDDSRGTVDSIHTIDSDLRESIAQLDLVAGSVERLSEQYSIEAHTIGSPILKSDSDQYVIQCRIIHTPTGIDYTDPLLNSARLITPEWYRINPEHRDRKRLSDEEWANQHRGDAEVVITRQDFITACTVGYTIPRSQIINAIKALEDRD